jgi:hypothetical protein
VMAPATYSAATEVAGSDPIITVADITTAAP